MSSVALGIDEYYMGVGEAPGVWMGRWSSVRGAAVGRVAGADGEGVRSDVLGTEGCSLLWALGSEPVADVVMGAHREAVATALWLLEERAALARIQADGLRRHVTIGQGRRGNGGGVGVGFDLGGDPTDRNQKSTANHRSEH